MEAYQTPNTAKKRLRPGDLIFQANLSDENDAAIAQSLHHSLKNSQGINHVGLCDVDGIIEAIEQGVVKTCWDDFLARTPYNFLCRHPDQSLASKAVIYAKRFLGKPYNTYFLPEADAFYCSELIVFAFCMANDGHPVFQQSPMTFKNSQTGQFLDHWLTYYGTADSIPEGVVGSHPYKLYCQMKQITLTHYKIILPFLTV